MTDQPYRHQVPRGLLVATDLSARCDRALDRAALLARQWSAQLIALNVLDPAASPEQFLFWMGGASDEQLLAIARREFAQELRHLTIPVELFIARHVDPVTAIRQKLAESKADLVITGVSRNEALGRFLLGSTVKSLAQSLSQPLLVVRKRAHEPYRNIVIATDFSESSRIALRQATALFPGSDLTVFHAYSRALSGLTSNATESREGADGPDGLERTEMAEFLAASELPADLRVKTAIRSGAVETSLARYVREQDVDLVVLGSHGRSGLRGLLMGTTANRLLEWLPCDVLLVPDLKARQAR